MGGRRGANREQEQFDSDYLHPKSPGVCGQRFGLFQHSSEWLRRVYLWLLRNHKTSTADSKHEESLGPTYLHVSAVK